jgi:hypothetical protein
MFKRFGTATLTTTLMFWSVAAALAQHEHMDVHLEIEDGQLITEPRIAEAEFGEDLVPSYRYADPGFAGHDLPLGAHVGFDVPLITLGSDNRSLWYWDGADQVDFGPLPANHRLKMTDPVGPGTAIVDGTNPVAGFDFATVEDHDEHGEHGEHGAIHAHLVFDLIGEDGSGLDPPAAGVYLLATTMRMTDVGTAAPLYWVAAADVPEAVHEAAVDYVHTTLVVPEPSATVLMTIAGVVLLCCRRPLKPTV